jgi:hypothetical protein
MALLLVMVGLPNCNKWLADPNGRRGMYSCGTLEVKSRISYFLCAEKVVVVGWLVGRIIECLLWGLTVHVAM